MLNIKTQEALFFSAILLSLLCITLHPESVSAQSANTENGRNNVIHFFAGLSADPGNAPRVFDYPLYMIERGGTITWQNDDAHAHTLKVTSRQAFETTAAATADDGSVPAAGKTIFESQKIEPGSTASFRFDKAGLYQVQSLADPSLQGEIVVADNMTTLVSNSNTTSLVNVALSWYHPVAPKAGGDNDDSKTVYFKIQFLDKRTGETHPHIDYTFAVLNSDGADMIKSPGSIHSGAGEEFASATFGSTGTFTPVITIRGISFVPIATEQVRFSMVVGP